MLLPIGFGDGGGGPTAEMIAAQGALADFPLLAARPGSPAPRGLLRRRKAEAAEGADVATWVGELYLEYHRGVLTSQGRTKRLHRQAERGLVAAEVAGQRRRTCSAAPQPASLEPLLAHC